ncbi:hypothetical protein ACER0A_013615 [Haloimpatiens sp. FM7315]|uniref:hypothetical protein n=1 Tax=Haloimpatiens sp. FM7315 TaxID=3298609 RepID=UPI0035A37BF4
MKETNQSPEYHPEGSVWNHTLMVTDKAFINELKSNGFKLQDYWFWSTFQSDKETVVELLNKMIKIFYDINNISYKHKIIQQISYL